MVIVPTIQKTRVTQMKINLKIQNSILLVSFLATVLLCLIYDSYNNSINPIPEPIPIFTFSDFHPWKDVFICVAIVAAVALSVVAIRYNKIRHQKVDNYLASLIFYSAIYQGVAYIVNLAHMIFYGIDAISQVGLKLFMPLGILALLFFTFMAIEVFIKPAFGHEREHGIERFILFLEAFGIVMGVLITLFTYSPDGSAFEYIVGAIGFSVLGMIGIIVSIVASKIFKIRKNVTEPTQARALEAIAMQLILLLAVTFLMLFAEMASFTGMPDDMAYLLRVIYSLLTIVIAWLYLPAFIRPAGKKE
jgi:hypothetical protein